MQRTIALFTACLLGLLAVTGCPEPEQPRKPKKEESGKPPATTQPAATQPAAAAPADSNSTPTTTPADALPTTLPSPESVIPEVTPPTVTAPEKVKSPFYDAKPGDFVKYKTISGTQTITVKSVDNDNIHVEIVTSTGGMALPAQQMKYPRWVPKVPPEATATIETKDLGTETVKVGNKELTCQVKEIKATIGDKTVTTKTWTSDKVLTGTVKTMSDGLGEMKTMQELVEFQSSW